MRFGLKISPPTLCADGVILCLPKRSIEVGSKEYASAIGIFETCSAIAWAHMTIDIQKLPRSNASCHPSLSVAARGRKRSECRSRPVVASKFSTSYAHSKSGSSALNAMPFEPTIHPVVRKLSSLIVTSGVKVPATSSFWCILAWTRTCIQTLPLVLTAYVFADIDYIVIIINNYFNVI